MKFYNRENELAELQRIQELSFEENSHLTVVTGRRRIGKTSLIMRAFEKTPTIYLFVGRKNEASLCREFITLFMCQKKYRLSNLSFGILWKLLPDSHSIWL